MTEGVIFDYKNGWMIWQGQAYICNGFAELMSLEKEFLEAARLPTRH